MSHFQTANILISEVDLDDIGILRTPTHAPAVGRPWTGRGRGSCLGIYPVWNTPPIVLSVNGELVKMPPPVSPLNDRIPHWAIFKLRIFYFDCQVGLGHLGLVVGRPWRGRGRGSCLGIYPVWNTPPIVLSVGGELSNMSPRLPI